MAVETSIKENRFTTLEVGENGSADDASSLARAIQEHLDLKQRNSELDGAMPIDRYSVADPFENHPLFKSEEQARLEETLEGVEAQGLAAQSLAAQGVAAQRVETQGVETPSPTPGLPWPGEDKPPEGAALDEGLWGRSRDFDWGE